MSRKRRELTREQVAARQGKAVDFLDSVVGDPDLADEIRDLSAEEYAARKGFRIVNPSRKGSEVHVASKQQLEQRIGELEDELETTQEDLERAESTLAEIAERADSALPEEEEEAPEAEEVEQD